MENDTAIVQRYKYTIRLLLRIKEKKEQTLYVVQKTVKDYWSGGIISRISCLGYLPYYEREYFYTKLEARISYNRLTKYLKCLNCNVLEWELVKVNMLT